MCSRIISELDRPWLLYVAALFHDIAKGRGGDHSELGTVDAAEFCQDHGLTAEDTGLIIPLDLWVMREACRTLNAWHDDFPREQPLTISINLSTRLFSLANLACRCVTS